MGDGFHRSKDPTNSIRVQKEKATHENPEKNKQQKIHTYIQNSTQLRETHIKHSKSPSLH